MDIEFSVSLSTPAQERDFIVNLGDDFKLVVNVYADEHSSTVDPETLDGMTLTFQIGSYPTRTLTAVGNTFTFTPPPHPVRFVRLRTPFRIVMTDADGLRTTLCYGSMVTRTLRHHDWFGGGFGNDYGWLA